jgi:hypothetical protein
LLVCSGFHTENYSQLQDMQRPFVREQVNGRSTHPNALIKDR